MGHSIIHHWINKNSFNEDDKAKLYTTLTVACCFRDIPFYLQTRADWRGRIYIQSFFLSYQRDDLSTSLIIIFNGKSLTETGILYFN